MAGRRFHLSDGARFGLLLCVGVILLILPRDRTQYVNFAFARTFGPLLRIGRTFEAYRAAMPHPDEQYVLREEHNKLWKNYNNLHAQLLKLQSDFEKLAKVRSGLPRFFGGLVMAEVVGGGLTQELLINKGQTDGVRVGYYVLSPDQNSVVGVVRDAADQMARVRLLTDANQSIAVRIRREGAPLDVGALMVGNGKRGGVIAMVEREKDIRVGDAVYAAAWTGILETPMIIGQVSDVQPDEESPLLWKIGVQPAENAGTLKTAAVIVPQPLAPSRQ